jgi:hypothetical protein
LQPVTGPPPTFALAAVVFSLEEIVITATGEQRKLELGHAITQVRADSV